MLDMSLPSPGVSMEDPSTDFETASGKQRTKRGGKRGLKSSLKAMFTRKLDSPRTQKSRSGHSRMRLSLTLPFPGSQSTEGDEIEEEFPIKFIEMPTPVDPTSPHDHLMDIIGKRGYDVKELHISDTEYLDSADVECDHENTLETQESLLKAIHNNDVDTLGELLADEMCAAEFPSSQHAWSVLHLMCRKGQADCLKKFLDHNANTQFYDGYGETALHIACGVSKPNFEIVKMLLKQDKNMILIRDERGCPPLSYTRENHWSEWKKVVESIADIYWPDQKEVDKENEP